ncbi:MAG: M48 family metalloprotease [Bacteroidetes bacterium]|nr:M48 family metalloprotease [Bacteroidota bacterium]
MAPKTILLFSCLISLFPMAGLTQTMENDEAEIWKMSQIEQRKLDESGYIYQDDTLEAYLNTVLLKVTGTVPLPVVPHVKVLKSPELNAFAFPTGRMYIHTGLLAKLENESQLATLFGHEITHSTHKHAIQGFRHQKSTSDAVAFLGVISGGFGLIGAVANLLGNIGYMASVSGYSKSNETEADEVGFQKMKAAGYNPAEAPALFRILKNDITMEEPDKQAPYFFSSHPKLEDRLKNYQRLLNFSEVRPDSGYVDSVFIKKTRAVLFDNISIDVQAGRFNSAKHSISIYEKRFPGDDRILFRKADLLLKDQPQNSESQEKAMNLFKRIIELDSTLAAPHKELGKWYFKKGESTLAITHFEAYLRLAPQATDRRFIEGYIRKINTKTE